MTDKNLPRWYPDGDMNICYNCLDRHIDEGRGDKVALLYDSVYTGEKSKYTYKEMLTETAKLATILKT